ncbi:hypothetical protein [Nonomuraea sp. NPDC046570]|uniref:hypothetical protein n=1 Tax=Nonomuraea sp. NPDC046570 TaxID=3155255 RepID=UPI0033D04DEE
MSRQMTFTLACTVVLSAIIPGAAGYLSARLEAVQAAERNLRTLEIRLRAEVVAETRNAAGRRDHAETRAPQSRPVVITSDRCKLVRQPQQPPPSSSSEERLAGRVPRKVPAIPPEWFAVSVTPEDGPASY